jgi:flagellar motor switch protein FliM
VLDTVLSRWARGIEESIFSLLGLEVYAGASVVEEMRFSEFFRSLKHARPIYLFKLNPLPGQGLLVLDNRLANACLQGMHPGAVKGGTERLRLTRGNQVRVQRVVQAIMERFDEAWADVEPVRAELLKVTTYVFRARVIHAYEQCLAAQLHLSGEQLSARLMLCVPRFMLAGAIEKTGRHPVVPAIAPAPYVSGATAEGVLGPARYEVTARLGTLTLTLGPEDFRVGHVIPLARAADGDVVLEIDGTPLLMGEAGDSAGRYAVRVDGPYRPAVAPPPEPPPFRPMDWPAAPK